MGALALMFLAVGCSMLKPIDFQTFAEDIQENTSSYVEAIQGSNEESSAEEVPPEDASNASIPEFNGNPYCTISSDQKLFSNEEVEAARNTYEIYGELDILGRCTMAKASVGIDGMPTESRGEIGYIKPTGWNQKKYEGLVNTNPPYLYNRCHLIAYCLTGENANEKNLITGTRYMNVEGMLPFEEQIARFVESTGYHVLYEVTPIFEGNNLLASGVELKAQSVEDDGAGLHFYVYCYNVQPGVQIDYATGMSERE